MDANMFMIVSTELPSPYSNPKLCCGTFTSIDDKQSAETNRYFMGGIELRSVKSRTIYRNFPKKLASSCMPPESVMTQEHVERRLIISSWHTFSKSTQFDTEKRVSMTCSERQGLECFIK